MKRFLVSCLVLVILAGMTFSVKAEDAGSITMDFTQFTDQVKMTTQLEQPSYGITTTKPVEATEFTSMNIKIVEVEDGIESPCWESNITTLKNITIDLDPGIYKVYTQLEGDDTVLEYNNDSAGYVVTQQSHLVITVYPPLTEGYILDVPWRIENSEINIPILAVDTGVNWADIYNIKVYDHNKGDRFVASTNWVSPQPIYLKTPFFYLFNLDKNLFVQVDGEISIKIKFDFDWWPLPDNWEGPKRVQISPEDIPTITDWYCGDTHQHTNYTHNVYEFGAPIYATRAANNAMGLDWMIVTDHSFDLTPEKWNVSSADCDAHSDNLFRVMQGEEVSCYLPGTDINPWQYKYNHLLVYGTDFIPGGEWEDGTGSDYTPAEAIAIANSQGGVTYLAHPFYDDLFRDTWRDKDYNLPFTGLQIWNYGSDKPTHLPDGIAKWSELLLGGRHVYVEGGTDAHGDFNAIAGKVKTYVYAPGYSQSDLPTRSAILNALRNGNSVMTDGPVVIFDINEEIIGKEVSVTERTNATLRIHWNSTSEFGYITNITVKKGVINETEETDFIIIEPSSMGKNTLCDEYELAISPTESCYYRVEAYSNTTNGEQHRCYTNPIWVNINKPPIAYFSYSPETPVVSHTITFNAASSYDPEGNITNYAWNFGDGNITNTTEPIITHSYASAGTYNISLTVTDNEGATNTTTKVIQPVPDTTPPASITTLTSTSGQEWINWTWKNPADTDFNYTMVFLSGTWKTNTSNEYYNATGLARSTSYKISTHTVDRAGNVNVTGINQTIKTPAENQPPIASFSYSPENPVVNEAIIFNASFSSDIDGNITKYEWNFGDGNITNITEELINHSYSSTGEYNITLTVTDDGCATNTTTKEIVILPVPDTTPPAIKFMHPTPVNNSVVSGDRVLINVTVDENGTALLNWNDVNMTMLGSQMLFYKEVTNLSDGLYRYKVYANDTSNNWNVSETRVITIDTSPPASITTLTSTSGHTWINWTWKNPVDADFNYTMVFLSGTWKTNTSNEYYNATGLVTSTSYKISTHTVDLVGNVNVTWINQTTKTQAKNQPPIASFSYSPENPVVNEPITFNASDSTDPAGNITRYEWDFGDGGNITNTTEPITNHTYASAGTFTVNLTVTDDDGATNTTSSAITVSGGLVFDTGTRNISKHRRHTQRHDYTKQNN